MAPAERDPGEGDATGVAATSVSLYVKIVNMSTTSF